jgi:uncharacterized protein (DUF1684 family)
MHYICISILYMKYFLNVIIGLMLAQSMLAQSNEKAFRDEIKQWDEKRIESLRSANGWVNLAGLFWLTPGENKFGAASDNQIVFNDPRFPAHLGSFILNEKEVMWKTAPGNEVYNKQQLVDQLIHFDINQNQGIQLAYQTFRWTIIKRENMVGVRFRDLDHPNLKIFHHIERYKPSLKWKINATLEQSLYASVSITNVLGQTYQMPSPGKIVFEIEGKKYKLDAVDEGGDDLFCLQMIPMQKIPMSLAGFCTSPNRMPMETPWLISTSPSIHPVHSPPSQPVPFHPNKMYCRLL